MTFKANYENICHWNQWVSNFATNSWSRYSGCLKGVLLWPWGGRRSSEKDSWVLEERAGHCWWKTVEPWLHKCQQEMGKFAKNSNRRVSRQVCLLYHLFSGADTRGKAWSDVTLVWGDLLSPVWLLLQCDIGENLSFLSCYAQLWTCGIRTASPPLLFPHA